MIFQTYDIKNAANWSLVCPIKRKKAKNPTIQTPKLQLKAQPRCVHFTGDKLPEKKKIDS